MVGFLLQKHGAFVLVTALLICKTFYLTPGVIKQRTNPILNGVRKLLETHDVSEALKALATSGLITRSMNTLTAITGTREAAQKHTNLK